MAFFTAGCVSDESCDDATWAIPLMIIGAAFVCAMHMILTTGRPSNGMLAALLFFYQVTPVVKSTPWQHSVCWSRCDYIQGAFSASPPDTGGDDSSSTSDANSSTVSGVCVLRNMSASQKILFKLLFQTMVILMVVAIGVVHWLGCKTGLVIWNRRFPQPASWKSMYIPIVVRFLSIAYLTLVLVPLQLVECMSVGGKHVWRWDAEGDNPRYFLILSSE